MKKWIPLWCLVFVFLLPSTTSATHEGFQDYFESHKPKIPEPNWSESDKKKISQLQTHVLKTYNEFNAAIVKRANKLRKDHPFTYSYNAVEAVPKARHEVYQEGKIFGKPNTYFSGSKMDKEVRELWETYGIKVHFDMTEPRGAGCGGIFGFGDDCKKTPHTISWPGDMEKNEDGDIVDYDGHYESPWIIENKVFSSDGVEILVASQGLFTGPYVETFGSCNVEETAKTMGSEIGTPILKNVETEESFLEKINPFNSDKIGSGLSKTFERMNTEASHTLLSEDCNKDSVSLVGQFSNISRPLNLTTSTVTLTLVGVMQQVAFTLAIVVIAFYALMYTAGYEQMNPVKFGIRLFLSLLTINFLPWLIQDVLNLNNRLVHFLANLKFDFGGGVEGNSSDILMGALTTMLERLQSASVENLFFIIFVFIMAILAIMPLVSIIIWWYIRMLRIFLGAIMGPVLILLIALPQTARTATTFIRSTVGAVFEQVFMVMGLALVAAIISNLGTFSSEIGVGFIGQLMIVFTSIFFLSQIPSFASKFLDNLGGGNADSMARSMAGGIRGAKNTVSKGIKNASKTASAAKNAGLSIAGKSIGFKEKMTGQTNNGRIATLVKNSKSGGKGLKRGENSANAKIGRMEAKEATKESFNEARQKGKGGQSLNGSSTASTRTERRNENNTTHKPSKSERVGHAVGKVQGGIITGQTWLSSKMFPDDKGSGQSTRNTGKSASQNKTVKNKSTKQNNNNKRKK